MSLFCRLSLGFLLVGCAPDEESPAVPRSPTPGTELPTPEDTDPPLDTGDTDPPEDTDPPPPPFTCEGFGAPVLQLGTGDDSSFSPFLPHAPLPLRDQRLRLAVRTEGLDVTQPLLAVVRVSRNGNPSTDTIGMRWLECAAEQGWATLDVSLPPDTQLGDALHVDATLTDHHDASSTASAYGDLSL